MSTLVLASSSPYRRRLLERLGLRFEVAAPDYLEDNLCRGDPSELVRRQALGKAMSLVGRFPQALILGSDQIALHEGEILTKPGNLEGARRQLRRLAGAEHRLLTALALVDAASDRRLDHIEITRIRLRALSDQEIDRYLERDRPFDCAGSYKVESLGIALFEHIEGSDPSAIEGLPLIATCRLLAELGSPVLG